MKKYFLLILAFGIFSFVSAQGSQMEIDFFYSRTCPHCAQEAKFLDELKEDYPEIKINRWEISENIDLLKIFYKKYEVPREQYGWVPITFFGDEYFLGFNEGIKIEIEDCIRGNSGKPCDCEECSPEAYDEDFSTFAGLGKEINIPFIGKINISKLSLPVLSVVLGTLDGFNVCSLGALVLILGLVLAIKSRKKVLLFGSLFILTTAIVYGILIVVWYQVFVFLSPYFKIMEILIGLLGIGGGIYFLKEFIESRKQGPACRISGGKKIMSGFSSKFQESLRKSGNTLLLLGSVFLFAGIITIVEFPCSAAVPVVFAGVLAKAHLSTFYYLLYIAIFIILYMLDEIIVFLIAFLTMTIWLTSNKFVVWFALVESIVLFGLGFYYLFGFSGFI